MQLKKILTVEVETTDGKKMIAGQEYAMDIDGRTVCGAFVGINERRGALTFTDRLRGREFSVMPSTIKEIYEAKLIITSGEVEEQEASDEA